MKIVRGAAVLLVVFGLTGAGSEDAARDQVVSPAVWNLAANWRTDDARTFIDLRPDGTVTAVGISNCVGPIGLFDPGTQQMTPAADVSDGEGTWSYGRYSSTTVEYGLTMRFRASDQPPLVWVVNPVEWRVHPVSVTLTIMYQPEGEYRPMMCTLHSP